MNLTLTLKCPYYMGGPNAKSLFSSLFLSFCAKMFLTPISGYGANSIDRVIQYGFKYVMILLLVFRMCFLWLFCLFCELNVISFIIFFSFFSILCQSNRIFGVLCMTIRCFPTLQLAFYGLFNPLGTFFYDPNFALIQCCHCIYRWS